MAVAGPDSPPGTAYPAAAEAGGMAGWPVPAQPAMAASAASTTAARARLIFFTRITGVRLDSGTPRLHGQLVADTAWRRGGGPQRRY